MLQNSSSTSSSSSSLSPSSVKGKWYSLPLANVFTETRVRILVEQGFKVLKEQGRLEENLREVSQQIADVICERFPGIFLDPNDVMTFCGTFMTSSDEENVGRSRGDVVVHTVEFDRRLIQEEEGGGSSSSSTNFQVLGVASTNLKFFLFLQFK